MTHSTLMSPSFHAGEIPENDALYRFGSFQLDPLERILLRGQEPVSLTPKAFDTLCVLVENSGRLVTKAQLLDNVWPQTYVEEKTLAQNIFTLRKALGTDPEGRNYIETIPEQGYRFSANVLRFPRHSEEVVARHEQQTELLIEKEIESDPPETFAAQIPFTRKLRSLFRVKQLLPSALMVALFGGVVFVSKVSVRKAWGHAPSFSKVKISKLTNAGRRGDNGFVARWKLRLLLKKRPGSRT